MTAQVVVIVLLFAVVLFARAFEVWVTLRFAKIQRDADDAWAKYLGRPGRALREGASRDAGASR